MNTMKVTFFQRIVCFFVSKNIWSVFGSCHECTKCCHLSLKAPSMIWSLLLSLSLSITHPNTHTYTFLSSGCSHCSFSQSFRISDPKIQSSTLYQFLSRSVGFVDIFFGTTGITFPIIFYSEFRGFRSLLANQLLSQFEPLRKQVPLFEAARAKEKIGPSFKLNHHCQI